MAEGILSTVAAEILMKLSSQASQRLGMLCGLKDDLTKFKSNVSSIQSVLAAVEKRPIENPPLEDWLNKLKEVVYDADDVLDELSYDALQEVMTRGNIAKQVRIFFSKSNSIVFHYRMASKMRNIWKRLDVIAVERDQFKLPEISEQRTQYSSFVQTMRGRETCSLSNEKEVFGRDMVKKRVKNALLDMNATHNVSFIAIVGIGGIGKTTLAKSLINDEHVSKHFDLKIWVWISDQFEINAIVEKIIESATKSNPNVKGKEALQLRLQEVIEGKKYLLVMDDVWDNESENEWNELKDLFMVGAKGSKIMITRRDRKLATTIDNMTSLFCLEGISKSDSWSLFRTVAFEEGKEPTNQKFKQLGEKILDKCGGVPLLIRHIGRALFRKTLEEWRLFKDNELSKVNQKENEMTSILKLSYNHLSSSLKQCFAYSSLYSKNEYIDKDELIRQWIAHGFLESPNTSKSMEDIGNDYVMELCWRFFYEYDNGMVRLHDVMHDLARIVGGNGYVCGNLNNDDVGEKIRHVSLGLDIESWNDLPSKLIEAKELRTFHKLPGNMINEAILDKLFSSFPRLRVLNMSRSNIKVLPNSLKKLRHLRYLNLSKNRDMELLPNCISELLHLQTLNLNSCRALKELPRDMNNLINLRHLDLLDLDQLTHIPKRIGKLTCLQTLHLFVLDNNKHGSKLSELKDLNNLRGELYIKGLDQQRRCSSPSEASLANLKDKKGLRDLLLEWKLSSDEYEADDQDGLKDEKILEGLEPHPNVESLSIWRYKGVGFPNWVSNSLFMKLTDISIVECNRVQHLPQLDQLPALKNLYLRDIPSLQFIDKKKNKLKSSVFFPCLEILILDNMSKLEGWWEGESTVAGDGECENGLLPMFTHLTDLCISNCPKLGSVPRCPCSKRVKLQGVGAQMVSSIGSFSNLNILELVNIEDLEYLPITLQQNQVSWSLQISNCPNFLSLPEWAVTPSSSIRIIKCPKLKSLPDRKRHLIRIEDCPQVEATFMGENDRIQPHMQQYLTCHYWPIPGYVRVGGAEQGMRTKIPRIFPGYIPRIFPGYIPRIFPGYIPPIVPGYIPRIFPSFPYIDNDFDQDENACRIV